jgi:hypothetical protein
MNNRNMPVRSPCPVRMFIGGMQVKSWQKQQGREEQEKNPHTPGRYSASQHNSSTLLLKAIIKKGSAILVMLHTW